MREATGVPFSTRVQATSASGTSVGQQVINGLFLRSIYSPFALGYTLVFGVLDIPNLAAVFMLPCFVALALVASLHLHIPIALPLAVVFVRRPPRVLLERVAFRPLRGRSDPNTSGLISSLATVFEAVAPQAIEPRGLTSSNPAT